MHVSIGAWMAGMPWTAMLALVLDVSIKAALVCGVAWLTILASRRASANARSLVWVFTLVVLMALPLAQLVTPVWNLPIVPEVSGWFGRNASPGAALSGAKAIDAGPDAAVISQGPSATAPGAAPRLTGPALAILAWLAGAALTLTWLAARAALGRRILERCDAADERWTGLLDECSARLGLNRRIRLLESSELAAAVTVGAFNPAIVVPAGSAEWPDAKRRWVLSHELAHVKRRDGLVEALAIVVKSVHWFNPFVWLAVKAARIERERDCDDAVLAAGARPSDYAMFLLDIAAELSAAPRPAWQLSANSQGSNLKERIMSILDPKIDRNRRRHGAGIVSCLVIAAVVIPLSVSGVCRTLGQDDEQCDKAKKEASLLRQKKADLAKKKETMLKEAQLQKEMLKMTPEEREQYKEKLKLKEKMSKMSAQERVDYLWEEISQNENSGAARIHDVYEEKGMTAAEHAAQEMDQDDTDYYLKEGELNTLGYHFLFGGDVKAAAFVFNFNVRLNPDSWNAHDSLGEALLAAGKLDRAREEYEKSLELNPDNKNGELMLVKIDNEQGKLKRVSEGDEGHDSSDE